MAAIYKDLFIEQGSAFNQVLFMRAARSLEPQNLSGYFPRGVFRKNPTSGVSHQLTVQINDVETGELGVSMTTDQTSAVKPGRYFYVIELVNNSDQIRRAFEGVVHVSPTVVPENGYTQPEEG